MEPQRRVVFGQLSEREPKEEAGMATEDWVTTVITNWGPCFSSLWSGSTFMRRYNRPRMWQEYITRHKEHMGRVEAQVDRIAAALELMAKRSPAPGASQ
jgi:hypothetical protein